MSYKSYILVLVLALATACTRSPQGQPFRVTSVETSFLMVDSSLNPIQDSAYLAQLAPLQAQLDQLSSEVIGYVPEQMDAYQPESPLLNWASDALFFPIRAQRPDVDFAIVNVGGLRCSWSAGDLTLRSVFELMPFDNEVVILTLPGTEVLRLADQIAVQGGQGVSGLTLHISHLSSVNSHLSAANVLVQGKEVDPNRLYYVVTSDYLSGGADGMDALRNYTTRERTGILIRDLYIDYAKTLTANQQPIQAACDGRIKIID